VAALDRGPLREDCEWWRGEPEWLRRRVGPRGGARRGRHDVRCRDLGRRGQPSQLRHL